MKRARGVRSDSDPTKSNESRESGGRTVAPSYCTVPAHCISECILYVVVTSTSRSLCLVDVLCLLLGSPPYQNKMSSPLDLTGKSHNDSAREGESPERKYGKRRRAKRHVSEARTQEEQVVPITHKLARSMENILFMLIFNVIRLFLGVLSRAVSLMFGSWTSSIGTFFGVDDSPLLDELPAEQQQQQQLTYIHENQVKQRQQLDYSRQRVQQLEQRQRGRELASNGHHKAN